MGGALCGPRRDDEDVWAVEKYIDHWDGYSGHAEPLLRPNNYYLFSEPSGRFQMLPWGADQTWIPTKGVPNREVTFEGEGGVLFNKCLEDKACFRQYWEARAFWGGAERGFRARYRLWCRVSPSGASRRRLRLRLHSSHPASS
jgi:hypothetical protein